MHARIRRGSLPIQVCLTAARAGSTDDRCGMKYVRPTTASFAWRPPGVRADGQVLDGTAAYWQAGRLVTRYCRTSASYRVDTTVAYETEWASDVNGPRRRPLGDLPALAAERSGLRQLRRASFLGASLRQFVAEVASDIARPEGLVSSIRRPTRSRCTIKGHVLRVETNHQRSRDMRSIAPARAIRGPPFLAPHAQRRARPSRRAEVSQGCNKDSSLTPWTRVALRMIAPSVE